MSTTAPLSHREIVATLCAPGQPFEMEELEIRGVPTRVWKHAARCLGDVLDHGRQVAPERDFIRLGAEHLTHGEHYRRVCALATRLVDDLGVAKGDRVAIAMRNYPEWSVVFFAAVMIGAVATPLNAFWNGSELAFGVTDSESAVLIADGERLERLAPHARAGRRRAWSAPASTTAPGLPICRTGSSTSRPSSRSPIRMRRRPMWPSNPRTWPRSSTRRARRGGRRGCSAPTATSARTWTSLMYVGARSSLRSGSGSGPRPGGASSGSSVLLVPVPLFHATGCHSILVTQAYFGGTLVFMRKWDPEVALDLIEAEGVTNVSGVPSMVWDIVNSPTLARADLSRLTALGGGGVASPPELLRRVNAELPQRGMSTGYGLTETSSVTATNAGEDYRQRPDSVGIPVPVCDVRVVADASSEGGVDVPPGGVGEIWIRGPNVVPGYWHREEETAATFTDGWLHTGDIGRVDDEGFLYILDRAKDIIIRGGENIASIEVEAALMRTRASRRPPSSRRPIRRSAKRSPRSCGCGPAWRPAPTSCGHASPSRSHRSRCRRRSGSSPTPSRANAAGSVKRKAQDRFAPAPDQSNGRS